MHSLPREGERWRLRQVSLMEPTLPQEHVAVPVWCLDATRRISMSRFAQPPNPSLPILPTRQCAAQVERAQESSLCESVRRDSISRDL